MTDNTVTLRAWQALHEVTDGPWELRDGFVYPLAIRYGLGSIRPADAAFIAAARSLVPEMAEEIERLRADHDPAQCFHCTRCADADDSQQEALRDEIKRLRTELGGARETIRHQCEAASWIAGHDRQGLDHLEEAMTAAAERDAAEAEVRQLRDQLKPIRDLLDNWDFGHEAQEARLIEALKPLVHPEDEL